MYIPATPFNPLTARCISNYEYFNKLKKDHEKSHVAIEPLR